MASTLLQSLTSSLTHLLLFPCCGNAELNSHVKQRATIRPNTVYNQYERRLFLRPIMPPTTRRQSRLMVEAPASPPEPETAAENEGGEGDERANLPIPPLNLAPPIMAINKVGREDVNVHIDGIVLPLAKADSPVNDRVAEASVEGMPKVGIGRSGHRNEQEIIDALHRSDGEEEIKLIEEAFHEEFEEERGIEAIQLKEEECEEESEEWGGGSEGDVEIEIEESSDTASTSPKHSNHSHNSHHSIVIIDGGTERSATILQPALTYTQPTPPPRSPMNSARANMFAAPPPRTRYRQRYRCAGWNGPCEAENELTERDTLRCKECGCWGLYKVRTERMVQFEAR